MIRTRCAVATNICKAGSHHPIAGKHFSGAGVSGAGAELGINDGVGIGMTVGRSSSR